MDKMRRMNASYRATQLIKLILIYTNKFVNEPACDDGWCLLDDWIDGNPGPLWYVYQNGVCVCVRSKPDRVDDNGKLTIGRMIFHLYFLFRHFFLFKKAAAKKRTILSAISDR